MNNANIDSALFAQRISLVVYVYQNMKVIKIKLFHSPISDKKDE
jgi:hypothetical protein